MVAESCTCQCARTLHYCGVKSTNFLAERAVALSVSMCVRVCVHVCVCVRMRDLALAQSAFRAQT